MEKQSSRDLALQEDAINLSKRDVLDICDGVSKYYRKKGNTGALMLSGAFKAFLIPIPESHVKAIWSLIIKAINKIQIWNAIIKDQGDENPLLKSFSRVIAEIKEGNFD